jgi:aryl-alcohol dehydrogenase-like predicted oxidoreductase
VLSVIQASRVGLGTNNFGRRLDLAGARAVVDAALDAGVTHLDTADIYGGGESERYIGEILEGRRDAAFIATKFGMGEGGNGTREYLRGAIDRSLASLRTDHVDLYYYHRPDGVTPMAETVAALQELVDEGKVRHIGISNVDTDQLREAVSAASVAAVQNEYNLIVRDAERDVLPLCRELDVGFVPYFPLAGGILTGKYRRGEPMPKGTRQEGRTIGDDTFDRLEALERFAAERDHTLLELAIAGLASDPGVLSVIAGAMTPEQLRANAAAGAWQLSADELAALRDI